MTAFPPPTPASGIADQPAAAQISRGNPTARLVLVITMLLVFIMAARTPLDSDMWWHLNAGEETLRTGQILRSDIFSFTRAGAPWTNVYWLADLSLAVLFRIGGYLALSGAVAALAVISMALVWLQCEGPVFLKAGAVLLGSVVSSVVWSPRPQLFSLVLVAAVGYVLYLYRRRGVDRLWVLPLLFTIWANLHGGYPLGLMAIGAVLAGECLNHFLAIPARTLEWRKIFRLAAWGALCVFAVLVNPFGFDIWRLPFQTVNMQVLQQFIPEWASPDFHQVLQQMLLVLLFAVIAAAALSGRMMDGGDLVTLLLFSGMALLARRNFGPFALVAAPLLTVYGANAISAWQIRSPWLARLQHNPLPAHVDAAQPRLKKAINLLLVALLALAALGKLYVVSHPALVDRYVVGGYPVGAAEWLEQYHRGGRVLNEYEWGGWIQRQMPDFPVFVDGRTDIFNDEVVGAWITLVQAGPGWQEVLSRYDVELIMLKPDRPLIRELPLVGWQELYSDEQVMVYGRK